jgi:hypothetical protein
VHTITEQPGTRSGQYRPLSRGFYTRAESVLQATVGDDDIGRVIREEFG